MNQRAAFSRDLLAELPLWEQKGWVSAEQAAHLRQLYTPVRPHSSAWWQLVLSLFAMLCVSAGVIALFAANWAVLSREVRVVLALTPLLLSQLGLLYALYARPASVVWRECSALVLALAVGASIALVAQTYHVESNLPAFLRVWLWLALPLPFLTRTWAVAFFVAFLVHVFGLGGADVFFSAQQPSVWEYPACMLALLALLFWQRQRGADYGGQRHLWRTFAVTNALVFAFALCLKDNVSGYFLPIWVCLAAWYLATRTLGGRNAMAVVFQLTLAVMLLFPDMMTSSMAARDSSLRFFLTVTPLTAVSAALLVFALCRWKHWLGWDVAFAASGILLFFLGGQRALLGQLWPWLPTLFVVILGLWRARIALDHSLFAVNAALIWVLMALFSRFVADELPLWLKGIVFIGAGAAFFILNLRLARRPQHGVTGGKS